MIEPTDEMRAVVLRWRPRQGALADDLLVELLAIVERDRRVCPRPAAHMEAEWRGEWPSYVTAAPAGPDIHIPLCPKCGDPVITSGCYPGDGVCGGDARADNDPPWDDMHPSDRANYLAARDAEDVPPNAGSAS